MQFYKFLGKNFVLQCFGGAFWKSLIESFVGNIGDFVRSYLTPILLLSIIGFCGDLCYFEQRIYHFCRIWS